MKNSGKTGRGRVKTIVSVANGELAEMLNAAETTADPMQLLGVMQQGLEQQRQLMDTIK